MKLGRDSASVVNYMMSGTNGQPVPTVGMGVTILMWTDRHAGTITRISASGKTFWFKQDRAIRTDTNGMSESQMYRFEPDPSARERSARLTKSGAWKDHGTQIRVGDRNEYHDFSF
jgi:hypothetical protein